MAGDHASVPLIPAGLRATGAMTIGRQRSTGSASIGCPPYRVLHVTDGSAPLCVADFLGESCFVIDRDGDRRRINGTGAPDGIGVRFHQEHRDRVGMAVSVWRICAVPGTGFMAEPIGADLPLARPAAPRRYPIRWAPVPAYRTST